MSEYDRLLIQLKKLRFDVSDVSHPEDHPTGETHPLFACGVEHACDEIERVIRSFEVDRVLIATEVKA